MLYSSLVQLGLINSVFKFGLVLLYSPTTGLGADVVNRETSPKENNIARKAPVSPPHHHVRGSVDRRRGDFVRESSGGDVRVRVPSRPLRRGMREVRTGDAGSVVEGGGGGGRVRRRKGRGGTGRAEADERREERTKF